MDSTVTNNKERMENNLLCPNCKSVLNEYEIASSKNVCGIFYTLHCPNCGAFCPTYYDTGNCRKQISLPSIDEFVIPKQSSEIKTLQKDFNVISNYLELKKTEIKKLKENVEINKIEGRIEALEALQTIYGNLLNFNEFIRQNKNILEKKKRT